MANAPQPPEFKSGQYEFHDEHNRQFSALSDSMAAFATMAKVLGCVFLVLLGLHVAGSVPLFTGHGPTVGLGVAALMCLGFGFFTSGAAASFRKIVETKNSDVWHLMNAVGQLQNMFGTLRFLIMVGIVAAAVGAALAGAALIARDN